MIRYELMYRFGGIYVDCDVECLRNIEPLVRDESCFCGTEDDSHLSTSVIGAMPGDAVFKAVIDDLGRHWKPDQNASISTGPWYLTRLLGHVGSDRLPAGLKVMPRDAFYSLKPNRKHMPFNANAWRSSHPDAYAIHHWAGSWCRQTIPRMFHRVWLGGTMPAEFVRYGETWLEQHPGWRMTLWTENNLFRLQNHRQFHAARSYSEKSDLARHEILLKYGGVYIDTDFECLRNIESLLKGVDVFAASESEGVVSTGIMGAAPSNPVISNIVTALGEGHFPRSSNASANTGPIFVTRQLRRSGLMDQIMLFPSRMFYPWPYGKPKSSGDPKQVYPHAYGIHHWAASWLKKSHTSTASESSDSLKRASRRIKGSIRNVAL